MSEFGQVGLSQPAHPMPDAAVLAVSIVVIMAGLALAGYAFYNRGRLGPWLPVTALASVERDITGLKRVIIMCHQVDAPQDNLRMAVEHNFARGVKYLFLISASHAQAELNGYYKIFEALARIHIAKTGEARPLADLVEIQQLLYDWADYPYIFYQFGTALGLSTIAFRGSQRLKGIAGYYRRLDATTAHTIAVATVSDGPQPIREQVAFAPAQFANNVREFTPKANDKTSTN